MEEWQKPETLVLWITIIAVFLLVLLVFITLLMRAFFQKVVRTKLNESKLKIEHQKSLLENSIETQEKERKRVAEDIHDALIGKLTVLQLQTQIHNSESNTTELIDQCIATARRISHDLSPPLLEFTPIEDLIDDIVTPWKKQFTINYHVAIRNASDASPEMKINITRIVQEVITNIHKYAKASIVTVLLRKTENGIALILSDNGVGFDLKQQKKGLGLKNIESRVQLLNGVYKIKSSIGKGTSTILIFKSKN